MTFKIARVQTPDRLLNQVQQNICPPIEAQFQRLSGQFVATLTGCTTTKQALVTWQKSTTFGTVTLYIPTMIAISNTTAATLTGAPKEIWPSIEDQTNLIRIEDNTVIALGIITVGLDGILTLAAAIDGTAFTASGVKGLRAGTISYLTVQN